MMCDDKRIPNPEDAPGAPRGEEKTPFQLAFEKCSVTKAIPFHAGRPLLDVNGRVDVIVLADIISDIIGCLGAPIVAQTDRDRKIIAIPGLKLPKENR
jgi:hypothetical protein